MNIGNKASTIGKKGFGLAALTGYALAALLHEPMEDQYGYADQFSFRILFLYPGALLLGIVPRRLWGRGLTSALAFELGLFITLKVLPPPPVAATAQSADSNASWQEIEGSGLLG
jgi:hypothetical protein